MHTATSETHAGWLAFFRDLVACGLTSAGPVGLVTSDAHAGLVDAVGATLPGTGWQRCRTHFAANLMSATPKSSWPWASAPYQAGSFARDIPLKAPSTAICPWT